MVRDSTEIMRDPILKGYWAVCKEFLTIAHVMLGRVVPLGRGFVACGVERGPRAEMFLSSAVPLSGLNLVREID